MRRHPVILAMFLLAGVVVNVAVAWGWAAFFPIGTTSPSSHSDSAYLVELGPDGSWKLWRIVRTEDRGVLFYFSAWDMRSLVDWATRMRRESSTDPDELVPSWARLRTPSDADLEVREVLAYGWPVLSMWCDYGRLAGNRWELQHGLEVAFLSRNFGLPAAVPLDPIWPGFAVNTPFYAAVLWLLIPGPFALRRFVRMKRGRCLKCGYLIGEAAVCSECGKALRQQAKATT